jgi:hypothetical protein
MITYTFSSFMRAKNSPFRVISVAIFSIFIVISHGLSAQGAQALSADELKNINEQPISKSVKNNAETGKANPKKPSFEHKEADGTSIKEYKESGKPTEVVVEGVFGTYEMTAPNDSSNPRREQDTIRVPTIRMPF